MDRISGARGGCVGEEGAKGDERLRVFGWQRRLVTCKYIRVSECIK